MQSMVRDDRQLDLLAWSAPSDSASAVRAERSRRGAVAYHAGQAAEDSVARDYARRGHAMLARRWRGRGGEIDLIARDGEGLIFVEVKKARTFDQAAERVTARQRHRIERAACEYVEREPKGQLTEMRFDVALVDAAGALRIVENAFL